MPAGAASDQARWSNRGLIEGHAGGTDGHDQFRLQGPEGPGRVQIGIGVGKADDLIVSSGSAVRQCRDATATCIRAASGDAQNQL